MDKKMLGKAKDALISDRLIVLLLSFLLVSLPLVPYRYLPSISWLPNPLNLAVGFIPLILCVIISLLWFGKKWMEIPTFLYQTQMARVLFSMLLVGLCSSLGAERCVMSLAKTLYYFVTGGLLCLIVIDLCKRNHLYKDTLVLVIVTGASLAAIWGLVEFFTGWNPLRVSIFHVENPAFKRLIPDPWFGSRIIGTMGHPVAFGAYLVLVLPLSLMVGVRSNKYSIRLVGWVSAALICCAILLTFSRGSWVALGALAFMWIYRYGPKYVIMILLFSFFVTVIGMADKNVGDMILARLQDTYENYVLNFAQATRIQSYGHVCLIFSNNPVLGIGIGMFRFEVYTLRSALDFSSPLGVLDTPDNMYLMLLAETGLLGLSLFIYSLLTIFSHLKKFIKKSSGFVITHSAWVMILAFSGISVAMISSDALYIPTTRITFWVIAGLAMTVGKQVDQYQKADGSHM